MNIRPTGFEDIPSLMIVLDETQLFPSEMLPDMLSEFLARDGSQEIWLTGELAGAVVAFCYAAPEPLTEGTWNMLALAVHPSRQGAGCGGAVVASLEATLKRAGHRVMIAETSGKDEFARTRAFYRRQGYVEEARIRDFWARGDDKVVFWKSLA